MPDFMLKKVSFIPGSNNKTVEHDIHKELK